MKGMDIQSYLSLTGISAPFFDFELRLLALQLCQSTFGGFGHLLCSLLFSLIQLCLRRLPQPNTAPVINNTASNAAKIFFISNTFKTIFSFD